MTAVLDTPPSRPPRLLVVTARYLPLLGGTEIHTYETARRTAGRGFDVTVLTTDVGVGLPTREIANGVNVIRVPAWPRQRDYYFAPRLFHVIRQGAWDLIHCQGMHTLVAPLAMLAAIRAKTPFLLTFHSGGSSSRLRTRARTAQLAVLRSLLVHAKRLICVSQFEANFFQSRLRLPPDRFVVIPNGADTPLTADSPTEPSPNALIVSVGRLERYKGHHRLIEAMPYVLEKRPDADLRIVGTGPFEAELRNLSARLQVSHHVRIEGVPAGDRPQLASILAKSSLVTLLSEYESQGIAAFEALQLKRPLLVANSSALHELAAQGLAREVELTSTPRQLAAAILEQLDRPQMPADVTLPTWESCADALVELYSSVVRGNSCVY